MATMRDILLACTLFVATIIHTDAWVSTSTVTPNAVRALYSSTTPSSSSSSVSSPTPIPQHFLTQPYNTECDNVNRPPSLSILLRSIQQLTAPGKTDIRGRFVDHARLGPVAQAAHAVGRAGGGVPALTPFAAHCFGHALADMLLENNSSTNNPTKQEFDDSTTTIVVGQDPRLHGRRLIDAFARGAESRHASVKVVYTGIATTPACSAFCRILRLADAGVMVTASHLPADKNGFKLFTTLGGQVDIQELGRRAADQAAALYSSASLPATSGHDSVMCSAWVDWMPMYAASLEQAVCTLVDTAKSPLEGLTIVLNAGNGSGGFFRTVLESLGANVSYCIHCEPDGNFFHGVPNPESPAMVEATIQQCVEAQADLGIMLDTDADRCGFIVPASKTDNSNERLTTADYEPLNRNRLIALLAVVFARTSPGCAVVTDSVTSEGLATFLYQLGLTHVRYLKGYANVIAKAKELTESGLYKAELAIETSGHCAMMENDYLDDGTYTAVTVVSLLARERASGTATGLLLDLIRDLEELEEIAELRMTVADESLDTMLKVFDFLALRIETLCESIPAWEIDTKNLEGVRVRTGNSGFLMLRKSLHDPIISLQIEGSSKEQVRRVVMEPLLQLCESEEQIKTALDTSVLREY